MFETFLFATDNGLKSVVFMVCSMEVGGGGSLSLVGAVLRRRAGSFDNGLCR